LGVSAAELLAENRLQANELIFPGQSLRLPGTAPDSQAPDIDPGIDEAPEIALVASQATPAEPVPATEASSESEAEAQAIASTIEVIPELAADGDTLARVASDEAADSALEAPDNALASAQAELAADPSDYSVADNDTIEVQALETLGHYADWLGIRTQRLRDINGISFGQAVVIGQRVRLDFSTTDRATFEARRIAYQRERQESFFSSYQIEDITDHVIRPGESLWILAQRTYNVPVWLLRQYNPDLNLDHVSPGMVVKFPHLRRIAEPSSSATVRS
jgi:membrane-bound lytic murein transglycosylase D